MKILKKIDSTDLLDLLYPRICPVCKKILPAGGESRAGAHPACLARLRRVTQPFCMRCGKPLADDSAELCYDCSRRTGASFESGRSLWVYDSVSSEAVFLYKFGRKPELAQFFADQLVQARGGWVLERRPQCIIPVPISRGKMRTRGFNQAGLIAELLGSRLGIPVQESALVRVRDTKAQKSLNPEQRMKNLKRAFTVRREYLKGVKRVLLVDDIFTTGATIEHCACELCRAGVEKVWFLTLCTGGSF